MLRTARSVASSLLLVPLLSAPLLAAPPTLALDGQTAVTKVFGQPMTVQITGGALQPVWLLADVNAGPTTLFNQSLPLGFTPFLVVLPLGALDGAGQVTLAANVPSLPELDGRTFFLLAAVADPQAPPGVSFSNGASFTLLAPPTAGAAQGTVVGQRVVLDGSLVAGPDGLVKPGHSIAWSLLQVPSGSSATIEDPQQPFATLLPDRAGDYVVRASIVTPLGSFQSDTVVHVWSLATTPYGDGAFTFFDTQVSGTVSGPAVQSLTVDGAPLAVAGNGSFGPVPVTFPPGEVARTLSFRVTHPDGTTANRRITIFQGAAAPFTQPSAKTLAARLNASALAQVAEVGEELLEEADLESVLLALPPQQVANDEGPFGFTIFSATIDFTNLSHSADMQFTLVPAPGGLIGELRIFNVRADFNVWGEILEIGYSLSGYMTTSPKIITATLTGKAVNGQLQVDVTNVTVSRQNFDFELNGFIGTLAELFVIESAVKEQVEQTVANTVKAELGPALAEVLGAFVLDGSLFEVLDVDVQVEAPITGVGHFTDGVVVSLDGRAAVNAAEPGSPPVTLYRTSPAGPAALLATSPSGQGYGAALAFADDFLNQVLAAGTAAGLLDGDLTSLFPSGGGSPVALATDQLAILFPGGGFETFAVDTPVTLRAHGTVPPLVTLTPGGPAPARVVMRNLEVEFEVATAYGPVPLLRVAMDGAADLDLGIGADGTLEAAIGASSLSIEALRIFPGASPQTMDDQVQFLRVIFNFALPDLIGAIGSIPLPSLEAQGLGLQVGEVHLLNAGGYVGAFGQLQLGG